MDEHSGLDEFFSRSSPSPPARGAEGELLLQRRLGIVVGGSLSQGLRVKLDRSAVVEGMAVGRYVVVRGQTGRRFFSIITDVALDSTNPAIEKTPPDMSDEFLHRCTRGRAPLGVSKSRPCWFWIPRWAQGGTRPLMSPSR